MKFAAIIEYIQNPAKVDEIRPIHRQYQSDLKEAGKLVVWGPFVDGSGALIVFESNSKEEVESMLRHDPFAQHGVFVSWVVRPWNVVNANRNLLPG